jgi:hypothetical protein
MAAMASVNPGTEAQVGKECSREITFGQNHANKEMQTPPRRDTGAKSSK